MVVSPAAWAPTKWKDGKRFRFLMYRHRVEKQRKGPLQLDIFEPKDFEYEYKIVVTNKTNRPLGVLKFHNGRGSQEKIFGEAKQYAALDVVPCKRLSGNQCFTAASILAHNLGRELQMRREPERVRAGRRRPTMWTFQNLGTLRQRWLHRAGRLIRPQGKLTLVISGEDRLQEEFETLERRAKKAA